MYRKDIDGLRSFAVISVVLFHLGFAPNGYLGVDVFFVLSGFLITGIIYTEIQADTFTIKNFYLRRIKRIIPLVLFVNLTVLIFGILYMLPNDLKNLAQSIIATNLFSNNILEFITTKDYWDISNELKPLMHTWSLGIEEQFYIFYPLLFIFFKRNTKNLIGAIILLTLISFSLYLSSSSEQQTFYFLHFRFFELSLGGIGAIIVSKKGLIQLPRLIILIILITLLFANFKLLPSISLVISIVGTFFLLITLPNQMTLSNFLLENKISVGIGLISFSIYMWHQPILAFSRYLLFQELDTMNSLLIFFSILLTLSFVSFYFIEQPFRKRVNTKTTMFICLTLLFITTIGAGILHFKQGVIKDIPELNIYANQKYLDTEIDYNMAAMSYSDSSFVFPGKINILVIGNSFARDWINVLQESKYSKHIQISYVCTVGGSYSKTLDNLSNIEEIWRKSNYVFFSQINKIEFDEIIQKNQLNPSKAYIIGVKNFGINNGKFYNNKSINHCFQKTEIVKSYFDYNAKLRNEFGNRYIDIMSFLMDEKNKVPVFTNDCKFISQDGIHLTKAGAKYIAGELDDLFKFDD